MPAFAVIAFHSFFDDLDLDDDDVEEERSPRRRGRLPGRGSGGGGGIASRLPQGSGLQRLLILVGAIVLIVFIGIWQVQRCQRDAEVRSYRDYVAKANTIAAGSQSVGENVGKALLADGTTSATLVSALDTEIEKQKSLTTNAQNLKAPGGLAAQQAQLSSAMSYRLLGLQAMRTAAQAVYEGDATTVTEEKAGAVSTTFQRLVASDVVYSDSYAAPAKKVLADKGIKGVEVADSVFVDSTLISLLDPTRMKTTLERIGGGGTGSGDNTDSTDSTDNTSGPVGTAIENVFLVVGDKETDLNPGETPDVNAGAGTDSMTLKVIVKNSGVRQVTNLHVFATIGGKKFDAESSVVALDPDETGEFLIKFGFDDVDPTIENKIQVQVDKVTGEEKVDNNVARYTVNFNFPA